MSESNSTVQKAAQEMVKADSEELKSEIATNGAYHVVVEGGYHQQFLSDNEADLLTTLLVDHGICGLITLANTDEKNNIARITPLVSKYEDSFRDMLTRLDDGNDYPGLYVNYDKDSKTYTVYEEG